MERRNRFLIGFAAAAITFGSLMAFVGPRHFNHHGHQYRSDGHGCEMRRHGHGFRDGDCHPDEQKSRDNAPDGQGDSGSDSTKNL